MTALLTVAAFTLVLLLIGAGMLHLVPRLGAPGRKLSRWLCRAPGLDLVILYFTVLPLVGGPIAGARLGDGALSAWLGLLGAIAGQILTVGLWTVLHELAHHDAVRGPRIVTTINRKVGPLRNHAAVWTTALAVPIFAIIRIAEYVVYPPLIVLVRFPRYKAGDWINVSRHKFEGLVGHDLIWCLYCDWMTGVWSLGSEMLRNVESFWCPIRFRSDKKCANCTVDFPDIDNGWVPADASMADVERVLDEQYKGRDRYTWFGHPARLTVDGRPTEPEPAHKQPGA